jgi:hypothetical protein
MGIKNDQRALTVMYFEEPSLGTLGVASACIDRGSYEDVGSTESLILIKCVDNGERFDKCMVWAKSFWVCRKRCT